MNDLVFIKPAQKNPEPFTTSEVIADATGVSHRKIKDAIRKHQQEIELFGKVASYQATLESGQTGTGYTLTEPQATFLVTLLKNTPAVVSFKAELVRQFYAMRTELMNRQMQRIERKPIRRAMTDVIVEVDDSKWACKKYTDLVYKSAVGKNASQLRKERGVEKKATASDYMTSGEVSAVTKRENQVAVLLELGMSYEQVKEVLLNRRVVGTLGAHSVSTSAV